LKTDPRVWVVVVTLFLGHFLLHVGFDIGPAAPDLLTVAMLLSAREIGMGRAAGLGLVFGLLEDALSVLSFGANTVAMTVVGALGAITRDLFVGDSLLFLVSYFVIGKWLGDFIRWVMVGEGLRQPFVDQVLVQGLVGGLYAAVVGIALMALTGLWKESPQ
jgi:cell shape-determining protein MreD